MAENARYRLQKYGILSDRHLRNWIKMYNSHTELATNILISTALWQKYGLNLFESALNYKLKKNIIRRAERWMTVHGS